MVVIGYQGIGKSTLARTSFRYIDLESSALRKDGVRWHNWYEPYCLIAEWLSKQGYINQVDDLRVGQADKLGEDD